ncbi:NAD(P)-binding protein [Hypoxylon sp. FL1150]|nr:NAD(P)-binding protein [Hypoxylon sp. FL1150]
MVKIAIAGGSGQVSQEIIDALLVTKKHHVTILSRKESPKTPIAPEIHWKAVDYDDEKSLAEALLGIHTLLSFVQVVSDPDQKSQKNLIKAAIAAGVKRFAPSEYGSQGTVNMVWWRGKEKVREYLEEVNANEKVLEYTLFQPGLFLNYLAYPHKTAKHVEPLQSVFDFENNRAMVVEGHEEAIITLTAVSDIAAVVARAVEYEGTWPTTGGIRGSRATFSQILEVDQKVRGSPFTVDKVKIEDLEAGDLKTSWSLKAVHNSIFEGQASALLKEVPIGILLSSTKGAWDISDDFNQIFPDYKFTSIEDFLGKVWEGKS